MRTFEQRGHDENKGDLYSYDELYRLTHVKFNSPEPDNPLTTQFEKQKTYNLDKLDNIISIIENQNDRTTEIQTTIPDGSSYQKLNQYEYFDTWGLAYDLNGNTTQKGGQLFTYDYRNQVVQARDDNKTVDFKYDAMGRRIEKTVTTTSTSNTNTTRFFYAGNQVIEERDDNDQVTKQFIFGNGIDQILRVDLFSGGTSTPYYFHTNGNGSIVLITDADGNVIERITYDTYGMPTITDATGNVIATSTIGNEYLFHGRRYDREINLYYYRARYYDPIMGRFLQTDPMGYADSMNLYQGFNMNGMNFVDPMGLQTFPPNASEDEIQEQIFGMETAIIAAMKNPRSKPEKIANMIEAYKKIQLEYGSSYLFNLKDLDFKSDVLLKTNREQFNQFWYTFARTYIELYFWTIAGEMAGAEFVGAGFADDIFRIGSVSDEVARAGVSISDDVVRAGANVTDEVAKESTMRVGRWMSKSEYQKMLDTGFVQKSHGNMTHISNPANPNSFKAAKPGSVYVEFDIPSSSIVPGGKEGWGIVPGPGSIYDKLNIRRGLPGYNMPSARNIKLIRSKS